MVQARRWRDAMRDALYGPDGFFVGADRPADHFRTSAHADAAFAGALARLIVALDDALGNPGRMDVVDVGAGRGELLVEVFAGVPAGLRARLRATAVELAPRPPDLPSWIGWRDTVPRTVTGLLMATEWLDNVPLDLATLDDEGTPRYLLTDGSTGPSVSTVDAEWLRRWWPPRPGGVAEIGVPRDEAWRDAVASVERGWALAIDYGHLAGERPPLGTLTGYRGGRQVPPIPDGTRDLTAHVAFDALASPESILVTQREALRALGVSGTRPPRALAESDPLGYLRALSAASTAAELTDAAGLGAHLWLLEPVGVPAPDLGFQA